MDAVTQLYEQITDKNLLIRRVTVTANHVVGETSALEKETYEQLDLFTDYAKVRSQKEAVISS